MTDSAIDPERPSADEERFRKGVALGLPLVTVSVAALVGILVGPATSILVIAAGLLLGVIALLWGSLRVLSGDAALSPALEALDMAAQGADALAGRKKMLLRALKDLENEHRIGKIEEDDYAQLASTYRSELKAVMKSIDESLAPYRDRAEEAARAHLLKAGVLSAGYRGALPEEAGAARTSTKEASRIPCPKCRASNERDAKFCKECATPLSPGKKATASADGTADTNEDSNDE